MACFTGLEQKEGEALVNWAERVMEVGAEAYATSSVEEREETDAEVLSGDVGSKHRVRGSVIKGQDVEGGPAPGLCDGGESGGVSEGGT